MSQKSHNEQLLHDLQSVIQDAETLLGNASLSGSEEFKSARERIETTIKHARDEIIRLERLAIDKTRQAMDATDDYIKENPWQAVSLGAAVGLLVGLLISRR